MSQICTLTEEDDSCDQIEVIFTADQIDKRLQTLANQIVAANLQNIVIVSIMKGSFVFTADLIRALHAAGLSLQVDFMSLSSYKEDVKSSGHVELIHDIILDVKGCDVIVVDDILQSGQTLQFAKKLLAARSARKVFTCVLLNKTVQRAAKVEADFIGFECPANLFVVGYGLDKAHEYRQLPFVGYISNDH